MPALVLLIRLVQRLFGRYDGVAGRPTAEAEVVMVATPGFSLNRAPAHGRRSGRRGAALSCPAISSAAVWAHRLKWERSSVNDMPSPISSMSGSFQAARAVVDADVLVPRVLETRGDEMVAVCWTS